MVSSPAHDNHIKSYAAASSIFPGKGVAINAVAEVELGAQSVKLAAAATDVNAGVFQGVAVADVTKESTDDAYQEYVQYDAVGVMTKGRVWVVSADAVDDLSKGVYVRFQNGAANPGAGLTNGTFRATANADYAQLTAGARWVAGKTIGSTEYGLLEINLPR
jgi:hypothetical protein